MFLTLKSTPLLTSFSRRRATAAPPPCTAFDETLIAALKSLPSPPPSLTLAWLSSAFNLLSDTINAATALVHTTSLLSPVDLDAADTLLDACNHISSLLHRLSRQRLVLALALLSEHTQICTSLAEWESETGQISSAVRGPSFGLRRTRKAVPSRKWSEIHRAIYAVETLSVFFAGAALVVLGGAEKTDMMKTIYVVREVPWAAAFKKVASDVWGKLDDGGAGEVQAVERKVRELKEAMDGGDEESVGKVMEEAKKATEEMSEAVEVFGKAVNGVFSAGVRMTSNAVQCYLAAAYK